MNGLLGYAALGSFLLGAIQSGETPVTVLGPIDVIGLERKLAQATGLSDGKPQVTGLRAKKPNVTGWEQH